MLFDVVRQGVRPVLSLLLVVSLWAPSVVSAEPQVRIQPLAVDGPVAHEFTVRPASQLVVVPTVPLDIAAARADDELRDVAGLPPRFAIAETTLLTPENSGSWEDLDERYQLWRLRIFVPGALSLNLGFTSYHLPKGARLSLYPADVTGSDDVRGIVTFSERDNEAHGELWTPMILADEIIVELVVLRSERANCRLELAAINKGYRFFGEDLLTSNIEKSGDCNVDVVCPEGDGWRQEIKTVGVISTGGTLFCTGAMLNNTAEDGTPYFLTANHCGLNVDNAASLVVYWNFESENCGDQGGGTLDQFMTGAVFLAAATASDFTLLLMDDPVDPAHNISFAGWDHSSADPTSATGIHHPSNDEKSISHEFDPTTTTSGYFTDVPGNSNYIRVEDWDVGTTERGSSGSPLFDQNHHVVGQLDGGAAACGNDESDWYGRFSVSWPLISQYLDPLSTGQTALDTYAPWFVGMDVVGNALSAIGNTGGPFSPAGTFYTLTNTGFSAVDFSFTADVPWIGVSLASGTLAAGASQNITVYFTQVAELLVNGDYAGTLTITNLTSGEGSTTATVNLQVGIPELLHAFDLTSDPNWSLAGDWAYGVPLGAGGAEHGGPDPLAGHTGNNVLGYNLSGDYPGNLPETHLVTTAINCAGVYGTTLRFWRWLNLERFIYDQASVAVSTDNVNFTTVWTNSVEIADSQWQQMSYDISAVADHHSQVYIRWTMGATDADFNFSGWNIDDIEVWGVPSEMPSGTDLPSYQLSVANYPNPFNPLTRVSYVLAEAGPTTVTVYDVQGRLVQELWRGYLPAGPGHMVWGGHDAEGQRAASSVYFVQVVSGGQRVGSKMVLLK